MEKYVYFVNKKFMKPINEIPMDYLIWLFPGLKNDKKWKNLYEEVLSYFLTKDLRIETKGNGWGFYFNDYHNPAPVEGELPFMATTRRMTNSKGEYVYEIGNYKFPYFIEKNGDHFETSRNYVAATYRFGGLRMVYEKNPNYYFYDGYGKIMIEAYLMRKPYIPKGSLSREFSENLPIEKLNNQTQTL